MPCSFEVRLKPKAKRNSVKALSGKALEISVTSAPIENKANEHLVKLLAETLRIPKSSVSIIRGSHSKNKAVSIDALDTDEVLSKLAG